MGLVALVVQGIVVAQYAADPFSATPVSDALSYDRLAQRIAKGGLADEPVFHQSPLFPLLLAATYRLAGPGVAALAVQALLTATAVALLVPLGVLWFRSLGAGVLAGILALLHAPIAFWGLKLVPVALALATQAALLVALGAARRRAGRSPLLALTAGLTLGVAALARAEVLLFAPFAAVALLRPAAAARGGNRRGRRAAAGLLLAGTLLAIAPVTLHNLRRGDFTLIASAGGENLFLGNQRGAEGGHTALHPRAGDIFSQRELATRIAERETGKALRPSQVSAFWRGRAVREVLADPPRWLRLELEKLGRVLHPGEPTEMYSLALERARYLPVLYALPLPVWGALFLAGIGVARALAGRRAETWPLAAFCAVQLGVLLLFFVNSRLRLPFVFALLPFAGFGVCEIARLWREGRRRVVALAAAGFAVFAAVSAYETSRISSREVVRLASVLSTQGRLDAALEVLAPVIGGPTPDGLALDQAGWVLEQQGRLEAAAETYRRALRTGLGARRVSTHTRLARVLEQLGERDAAAEHHDSAAAAAEADAGTFYERGMFRLRGGDRSGARRDLERAARMDPSWSAPRRALERLGSPAAQP